MNQQSKKELLIEQCSKNNVCIFVDDQSESSIGIYAEIRSVASEAELQRRLDANIQIRNSIKAFWISVVALVVSVLAVAISFYKDIYKS